MSEELTKKNAKYILYCGLEQGNTFFSMNNPKESKYKAVRLYTGEIAYKIIGYANTVKEAQIKLYGYSSTERED